MLEMFTDADPMRADDFALPADGWHDVKNKSANRAQEGKVGSGTEKRRRDTAVRAYRLKLDGITTNEIAKAVDRKPDQIKKLILLGERLLNSKD